MLKGERDKMAHESGFGDGSQIRRLRKHDDDSQPLSQSQLLLRKELQELSVSNGSVSGLNVLYQQKNPLHPFTRSNFEITPIVSRVDNRPSSSSIYSENELSEDGDVSAHSIIDGGDDVGGGGDNESIFGSKPDLEKSGEDSSVGGSKDATSGSDQLSELEAVPISSESTSTKSNELNAEDKEDISKQIAKQLISDTIAVTAEEIVGQINVSVKSSEAKQIETETAVNSAKLNSLKETQLLQRTPSPICFFKNPGFGNRYAVNMRKKKAELGPLVAATFSSSNINLSKDAEGKKTTSSSEKVVKNGSQDKPLHENNQLSSSSKTKDSTQFLLEPVLSQSNVSICEEDLPEKLVKKRKKRQPFSHSKTDGTSKVVTDSNPMEEITKYNKTLKRSKVHTSPHAGKAESVMEEPLVRLRSDPAKSNLCRQTKRSGKPPSSPPESSGDHAPSPPKVNPERVELPETLDIPQQSDTHEKVELPKKVESTKKRVTFKEIQVEEKEFKLEDEIIDQMDLDCNNNTNSKETSVTEQDFFNNSSNGLLEEPLTQPSQKQTVYSGMLSRPESSSSIGNIPSDSWIAFPVRICADLMRTVIIPWPLIGLCVLVVIIAGFLGIFLNRLAAVVDRKHREVQLD